MLVLIDSGRGSKVGAYVLTRCDRWEYDGDRREGAMEGQVEGMEEEAENEEDDVDDDDADDADDEDVIIAPIIG